MADKDKSEALQTAQTELKTAVAYDPPKPEAEQEAEPRRKFEDLPAPAQRALLEAQERRKERDAIKESANRPKELGGRGGLDPSRYNDYEIDGRAIDF
ncbi:DUF1674 domain-containing protein [Cohaesibacter celericrescens]|uniref:DUF1674 domain-containing protein n=1 Tax=Cohaesibacter celericrescens TaxID=2067669 RepID=A0A2N5XPC9_9HYPH|nr:DUF1674 domain-containing protein [Cohaesibacter celericrescens]